MYCLARL